MLLSALQVKGAGVESNGTYRRWRGMEPGTMNMLDIGTELP